MIAPTLTDSPVDGRSVTLRAHRPEDAEGSWEQCQDPLSQAWTTVPVPYSREMAASYVTEMMPALWLTGDEWGFAVEYDGRYAGTVSLRNEGPGRAEIAYGSHPAVRGLGVMERALRLLLDWGFVERDLHTVIWWAHRGNWASRKLAWRLGFEMEGALRRWLPQRGELRDAWVGTLLSDDPRAPSSTWLDVPVLDHDGLRLRPWRESDIPRIVEACSDADTQAWIGRLPVPYTAASARDWLEHCAEALATGSAITWAVVDPREDLALASVMLLGYTPGVEGEVGYWVHPDARGRGVATRAMAAVVRHAFDDLGVARVRARAAVGNVASRRVIEANGLTYAGVERLAAVVREGRADLAIYDVLASEAAASVRR